MVGHGMVHHLEQDLAEGEGECVIVINICFNNLKRILDSIMIS